MEALKKIAEIVFEVTGINVRKETSRRRDIVDAKRIYGHIARELTVFNTKEIGFFISRDHATIIHYVKTSLALIENNKDYSKTFNDCLDRLKGIDCKNNYTYWYKYHLEKARQYRKKILNND